MLTTAQLPGIQSDYSTPFSIDIPVITLDESKLQELWSKGIINDLTYVSFALELHGKKQLDISRFAVDWSVTELSEAQSEDGWKVKRLKVRSVLSAICLLDEKGYSDADFNVQVNQLSLFV